jgi:hypothetical protein
MSLVQMKRGAQNAPDVPATRQSAFVRHAAGVHAPGTCRLGGTPRPPVGQRPGNDGSMSARANVANDSRPITIVILRIRPATTDAARHCTQLARPSRRSRCNMEGVWRLLFASVVACASPSVVNVELTTDLVAGEDFAIVDVQIGAMTFREPAFFGDTFDGRAVAMIETGDAEQELVVALLDAEGSTVAEERRTVAIDGATTVEIVIAADCAIVRCPRSTDPESYTACDRAQCVPVACEEGATMPCYDGPPGTDRAPCSAGTSTCTGGVFGACEGQRLPREETVDATDEDCDGVIDDGFGLVSSSSSITAWDDGATLAYASARPDGSSYVYLRELDADGSVMGAPSAIDSGRLPRIAAAGEHLGLSYLGDGVLRYRELPSGDPIDVEVPEACAWSDLALLPDGTAARAFVAAARGPVSIVVIPPGGPPRIDVVPAFATCDVAISATAAGGGELGVSWFEPNIEVSLRLARLPSGASAWTAPSVVFSQPTNEYQPLSSFALGPSPEGYAVAYITGTGFPPPFAPPEYIDMYLVSQTIALDGAASRYHYQAMILRDRVFGTAFFPDGSSIVVRSGISSATVVSRYFEASVGGPEMSSSVAVAGGADTGSFAMVGARVMVTADVRGRVYLSIANERVLERGPTPISVER